MVIKVANGCTLYTISAGLEKCTVHFVSISNKGWESIRGYQMLASSKKVEVLECTVLAPDQTKSRSKLIKRALACGSDREEC